MHLDRIRLCCRVIFIATTLPFLAHAQPPIPLPVAGAARNAAVANVAQGVANGVANSLRANIAADQGLNVAGAANAIAAADRTHVLLTSPGQTSAGFRRLPASGGGAAPNTLFPSSNGGPLGVITVQGTSNADAQRASGGGAAAGAGAAGGAGATTVKPAPTTTFPGYLVGSPYPFVLPPPDIPYFGSKWNGPWGYPIGHYQAFRGTGQYITHYQYYPLSYFGSLMAPFAYGMSGKK